MCPPARGISGGSARRSAGLQEDRAQGVDVVVVERHTPRVQSSPPPTPWNRILPPRRVSDGGSRPARPRRRWRRVGLGDPAVGDAGSGFGRARIVYCVRVVERRPLAVRGSYHPSDPPVPILTLVPRCSFRAEPTRQGRLGVPVASCELPAGKVHHPNPWSSFRTTSNRRPLGAWARPVHLAGRAATVARQPATGSGLSGTGDEADPPDHRGPTPAVEKVHGARSDRPDDRRGVVRPMPSARRDQVRRGPGRRSQ